jgi:hypothetical protein
MIDQRVPFQRPTSALSSEMLPTATQLVSVTQLRALRLVPFGPEIFIEDQCWPFQCRANAGPEPGLPPTATHIEPLTHEIPASVGDSPLGMTDHFDPFQRSISDRTIPCTF